MAATQRRRWRTQVHNSNNIRTHVTCPARLYSARHQCSTMQHSVSIFVTSMSPAFTPRPTEGRRTVAPLSSSGLAAPRRAASHSGVDPIGHVRDPRATAHPKQLLHGVAGSRHLRELRRSRYMYVYSAKAPSGPHLLLLAGRTEHRHGDDDQQRTVVRDCWLHDGEVSVGPPL